MASGGPFDNCPPGWTASPSRVTTGQAWTDYVVPGYYPPQTFAPRPWPDSITVHPNVMEQMGTDPISKLAAAIEKLADALAAEDHHGQ